MKTLLEIKEECTTEVKILSHSGETLIGYSFDQKKFDRLCLQEVEGPKTLPDCEDPREQENA